MAESTTQEALIAELLGDVGKLNDAVKELANTLPSQAGEIEARLSGLIDQLNKAGESYQERIREFVNAEATRATALVASDVRDAVRAAIHAETAAVIGSVKKGPSLKTTAFSMAVGAIGAILVLIGWHFIGPKYDQGFADASNIDRAWHELTPAERQHIRELGNPNQVH